MDCKLEKQDITPKGRGHYQVEQWNGIKKGKIALDVADMMKLITNKGENVKTYEQTEECLRKFFIDSTIIVEDENGNHHTEWRIVPTKTRLATYLGMDVQTLANYVSGRMSNGTEYTKSSRYSPTRILDDKAIEMVRIAVDIITDYHESRLGENQNVSGSIFWLNNLHNGSAWSNEQAINVKTANEPSTPQALVPREMLFLDTEDDTSEIKPPSTDL